jgi:hypothetical protein
MKRLLITSFAAAVAAVLTGSLVRAESRTVPVNVKPAQSIEVVLFKSANAGKSLVITDRNGKGNIDVDVAEIANLGKLVIIEEKCPDRTRVLVVAAGAEPQSPNCSKKVIGFWVFDNGTPLNVHLSHGIGAGTKLLLGSAAGAGALVYLERRDGNDQPVLTEQPAVSVPTPSTIAAPTPSAPSLTALNGTYAGSLTATANSCDFSPTASIRGVLSVDANGRGTWQKTHVGPNVTFNFNITLSSTGSGTASFSASTSQQVGSRTFSINDVAAISGTVMTITQTFTSTSGQACTVRYTGQLSRS